MYRIYKKLGETPLEALERFRLERVDFKDLPMTYAGRLDPMAEGELVVLVGEECKKKEEYLKMNKEYEFEILFGFSTDTYDILGICEKRYFDKEKVKENLEKELDKFKGKTIQKYPPYSSKTIDGVPLFQKTRDGDVFDLPEREVEIYEMHFEGFREISGAELLKDIEKRINLVSGDFRQGQIVEKWREALTGKADEEFIIAKARMKCSSGTYVRTLVNDLPFPSTTFSIKRTSVYK